jgi:hypothetical protein
MPTPARSSLMIDAVVARIQAGLPPGDPTVVEASFVPVIADADGRPTLTGRRCWVLDESEAVEMATRTERYREYGVRVFVAERYLLPGDPPLAWLRERIAWVEAHLFEPLSIAGFNFDQLLLADPLVPHSGAWPSGAEVVAKYDRGWLSQHKLFASELLFRFQELAG